MPFVATWMKLETLILSEVSQKEKDKYLMISHIWNKEFHKKETRFSDLENRLVVAKREGEGVGWTGNLGLIDADYCLWNGLAMRYCCIVLGTTSGHL